MRQKYFQGNIYEYTIVPKRSNKDVDLAILSYKKEIKAKIQKYLKKHKNIKFTLSVQPKLIKYKYDIDEYITILPWFNSESKVILHRNRITRIFKLCVKQVISFFDLFVSQGSGWILQKVLQLKIQILKYNAVGGGCFNTSDLPKCILNKRACLNVLSTKNKCFLYSVLAGLHPKSKNAERKKQYEKYFSQIISNGLKYPVTIDQIPFFEKNNNISINVFTLNKNNLPYVIYLTENRLGNKHINLLLYKNHFWLVKDLSRLFANIYIKNNGKKWFCNFCLHMSYMKEKHDIHIKHCNSEGQICNVPPPKTFLKFENYERKIPAPFVIYADFECVCEPIEEIHGKTTWVSKHLPIAFGAILFCRSNDNYTSDPYIHSSPHNCIEDFIKYLYMQKQLIHHIIYNESKPMKLSPDDIKNHKLKNRCYICGVKFSQYINSYRDHDHLKSGYNYSGASCNRCNLKFSSLDRHLKIPVVLHNLSGYDSHLIVSEVLKYIKNPIYIIPKNSEKFLTFSFDNFRFIDSFAFLPSSISNLTDNLRTDENAFSYIKTREHRKIWSYIFRKGVFPYDYITSYKKLLESQLPPKEAFFNKLTNSCIKDSEYVFAQEIWNIFKCETLLDYMKVYLKSDVSLLLCIVEKYRDTCLEQFKLDPLKYISSSQLSFDAMLKKTHCKFELLCDKEMYSFMEKGLRGGISTVNHRYAKANNKYLKDYNSDLPNTFIIYIDANSLYAEAMLNNLPVSNFRWMTSNEISKFDVNSISDDNKIGYILSVDLQYPPELHEAHNIYPLAPEKYKCHYNELSDYTHILSKKLDSKLCNVEKLVPNFYDKKEYIVHYSVLKFYLTQGLKLQKINKILCFTQSTILKSYVQLNNSLRKKATNEFDRQFYKLMNNSVFGKTCESVRRHIDLHLTADIKRCNKLISRQTFKSIKMCNNDLASIQLKRRYISLNKPIYLGFSILDLSKLHMYKFLYNYVVPTYGLENVKLCYTDTDSLILYILCEDIYNDIAKNQTLFDTSNYCPSHKCFSLKNKQVSGKFKDETGGIPIAEFCGLRAKSYSILLDDTSDKVVCKGIKSYVMEYIRHSDYIATLINGNQIFHNYYSLKSTKHNIHMCYQQHKIGLSPLDDKRYILSDGVSTLALGHFRIRNKRKYKE